MAAPFLAHWYVIGAVPETPTEKVAVCPIATFTLLGCEVTTGAVELLLLPVVRGLLGGGGVCDPDKPMHPLAVISDAIRKTNRRIEIGEQGLVP